MREVSPLKKHIQESPKLRALREKRHKRRMRILIAVLVFILILIAGFVYASRVPRIQITTVTVSGNKVVDTDEITAHVDTLLGGHYMYLIPHRNAFLYPRSKILGDLERSFPRFKSVSVDRTDLHTVAITVTEVRGRALWCGSGTTASIDAPCYFTDDAGKIVSNAPYYSGNVYPRFFGGAIAERTADPVGMMFTDAETFQNLIAFETRVEGMGFEVKGIVIGEGEENMLVLDLGAGKTAPVRFQKADNFQALAANMTAALSNPELKKTIAEDKASLEYFDLRFTNKVYYKFTGRD
jgi:hypothetical protein